MMLIRYFIKIMKLFLIIFLLCFFLGLSWLMFCVQTSKWQKDINNDDFLSYFTMNLNKSPE